MNTRDMGGPLRGVVLRFDLIRAANPIDGAEEVIHTEMLENLYPDVPQFIARLNSSIRRYGATLLGRLTVVRGNAAVLGDLILLLRMRRSTTPEGNPA